ncbi:alpha/beta hydrolase fold protein [Cavenderia fasciculata]|uniref:Alpha/beta hydrolase fold protein n=1 Tax=Cavenderia fasciculata TaxID=261658 RepID=F4PJN1_CACFS|nr:alpha/beta hydrolase fold protein [Cavenderia fasciculata]EGG23805.1 alpha/beta hydrolase fold protein [Cavenderia fasciculata]|eukprot:XP_004361656.1 alpha/beta hydrolase fold protein [Cavenderia fasciculata]
MTSTIKYNTIKIDNQNIFYRESGDKKNPTLILLHGFPSSSHQYRHLLADNKLTEKFHLIAPDYIGYGQSSMPSTKEFEYTFDNLSVVTEKLINALSIEKYSLYVFDYGAPIGYRLALRNPEKIQSFIVQNGNAYDEGIDNAFWANVKKYWAEPTKKENIDFVLGLITAQTTQWQYLNGVQEKDKSLVAPDGYVSDQYYLDRPGNGEIQAQLLFDYGTNPAKYPAFQQYFRQYQPPMLIVWGKNDEIFPAEGAYPYKKDIKNLDFHLFETGHFTLETHHQEISHLINQFLTKNIINNHGKSSN